MDMEERYIASVDIGTHKTALCVAKVSGEDVQMVWYRQRPSDGVNHGSVYNIKKTEAVVAGLIAQAQAELGIDILQVVAALPRCDVREETASAKVQRNNPDDCISKEEVESLKRLAQDEYPLQDPSRDQLYEAVAQSFSDDENFQLVENDIIGVLSENFEGNFKLFIGKRSPVRNLESLFNRLEIGIAKTCFTPAAQSRAILTEEEMTGGVALIDFGAGATSVTIYEGRILRFHSCIPFGGDNVTKDIMNECHIFSKQLADNLKYAFGVCMPERLQSMGDKIIQIEGFEVEQNKKIPVRYLSEIITCRMKEIIDAILYEIQRSTLADKLRCGLVITGGGAELTNLKSFLRELSGYSVRTGYSRNRFSANNCRGIYDTAATSCVGMILSAAQDDFINCAVAPTEEAPETVSPEAEVPEYELSVPATAEAVPEVTEEKEESGAGPSEKERNGGGQERNSRPFKLFSWVINYIDTLKDEMREDI